MHVQSNVQWQCNAISRHCITRNVLISSQIISACSVSSKIHHLHLKFAFFLWLFFNGGWTFGESNNIKSFQIWWISETKWLVSILPLWSSISSPQIRQNEARCWTWIYIRLLKLFWPCFSKDRMHFSEDRCFVIAECLWNTLVHPLSGQLYKPWLVWLSCMSLELFFVLGGSSSWTCFFSSWLRDLNFPRENVDSSHLFLDSVNREIYKCQNDTG